MGSAQNYGWCSYELFMAKWFLNKVDKKEKGRKDFPSEGARGVKQQGKLREVE